MRKIRIIQHISLDGVIQAPGGRGEGGDDYPHGGWTAPYRGADGAAAVVEAQGSRFDLLLGRRTYDVFAGHWPKASGPLANGLNAATKYVATHRPDSLEWGPVGNLGADAIAGARSVKSKDGPDLIVWGSSTLTRVLLEQGLIDEIVLLVYPVFLGTGKRFFENSAAPRELALVSTKLVSSTVLVNTYRYVGALRTE
ncbi:MAG TPA: dihydrofolate reductase family protein [Gemmatimonadaceae bacterium]